MHGKYHDKFPSSSSLFASAPSFPATNHLLQQFCPGLLHSILSVFSAFLSSHRPNSLGICVHFWPPSLLHAAHALLCPSLSSDYRLCFPRPLHKIHPLFFIALYVQNCLPRTFINLTTLPKSILQKGFLVCKHPCSCVCMSHSSSRPVRSNSLFSLKDFLWSLNFFF